MTEPTTQAELRRIKEKLLDIAESTSDASLLLQTGFQLRHPSLFAAAKAAFGSWESALTELVILVRDKETFRNPVEVVEAAEGEDFVMPDRPRDEDADAPLPGLTTTGELVILEPDDVPLTQGPVPLPYPEELGGLRSLSFQGKRADLVLFTESGLYFGLVHDFLPTLEDVSSGVSLKSRLELVEGDNLALAISRHHFSHADHRLYHVTQQGKAKATEMKEYTLQFGRTGREAYLCREGDAPLAVLTGQHFSGLFCASAMGQGIHMGTKDIRSMGRKSMGVNVMSLAGAEDAIVSTFLTEGVEEVAMMTQDGFGKRLEFREFRRQGRGGQGLQVARLPAGVKVVGVVPVTPNSDLLITTSAHRMWRFPALLLTPMGRPARGKRLLELQEGEEIVTLTSLPCGGNIAAPNTEEVRLATEESESTTD